MIFRNREFDARSIKRDLCSNEKKPLSEEDVTTLKELLFPGLPHLQLSHLGGGNNSNWKILDEHNGHEYMLRCAQLYLSLYLLILLFVKVTHILLILELFQFQNTF
ncbi:hypothetical protein BN59_00678 [Legionella massiliensis]|uniref:Uncharacterized protein n=1 Tax=Legionella massiliensis TaxID=1034943 RepID=A0A078KXC5_9GAMM|nr:hypothetical protein BN59_00678 [Legionella massiliensis]CEE12147.1 hypothetical protein BN1094_00678 [Legionella massiliensis]